METPHRTLQLLIWCPMIAVSLSLIAVLYPSTHVLGSLHLPLDAHRIVERAQQLAAEMDINISDFGHRVRLKTNRVLVRIVQQEHGFVRANETLRDRIVGSYWEVQWSRQKPMRIFSSASEERPEESRQRAERRLYGDVLLRVDAKGNFFGLRREIGDTVALPSLQPAEAHQLAEQFLSRYLPQWFARESGGFLAVGSDTAREDSAVGSRMLMRTGEKKIDLPHRADYEFSYSIPDTVAQRDLEFRIGVAGSVVSSVDIQYKMPAKADTVDVASYYSFFEFLLYAALAITLMVVGIRRFRAYEMGFKNALVLGIVGAAASVVSSYFMLVSQGDWEILIPIAFIMLFFGGGTMITWSVAEVVGRETWRDKFVSFDLLLKGYALHSRVGESVLRGMAFGFISLLGWLGIAFLMHQLFPTWSKVPEDTLIRSFETMSPATHIITSNLSEGLLIAGFSYLFVLSFARQKLASIWWVIIVGSIVAGLLNTGSIQPIYAGIGIETVAGFLIILAFVRHDVLAGTIAVLTHLTVTDGLSLFVVGAPEFVESGYLLVAVMTGVVLWSFVSIVTRDRVHDFDSITPAFARNITERQRLQQELEIARTVQMSFLPKESPRIKGLDIASRCVPAKEVGGDYFDFVELTPRRICVAVGDVSGKGTQAAFYMTLAKGFLRALSGKTKSARDVLNEINKLFYQNVERGAFVSMVYGIFDLGKKRLSVARAGHTPVLVKRARGNGIEVIQPEGLALGLEEGQKFSRTLEEVEMPLRKGDIFVFYTDGFTEAMNPRKEEFGDGRLVKTLTDSTTTTAQEVLDEVFGAVRKFAGRAKQHDDMTIVVVRVV
ncbi:MAG: PP2C family protein-serine/threonine phosphatase [Ignavibacteria bacterium]|nr:PP2C family protein-serine/threonine phosphatase [Ignavibacteria bacterium]